MTANPPPSNDKNDKVDLKGSIADDFEFMLATILNRLDDEGHSEAVVMHGLLRPILDKIRALESENSRLKKPLDGSLIDEFGRLMKEGHGHVDVHDREPFKAMLQSVQSYAIYVCELASKSDKELAELRAKNQELEDWNRDLCIKVGKYAQAIKEKATVDDLSTVKSPWTSVSERLPTWEELPKNDKDQAMFMVLQNIPESYGYYDAHIKITLYCEKKAWFNLASIYFPQMVERGITHWMAFPIPSPDDTNTQVGVADDLPKEV